jgi:hypothetical protein
MHGSSWVQELLWLGRKEDLAAECEADRAQAITKATVA